MNISAFSLLSQLAFADEATPSVQDRMSVPVASRCGPKGPDEQIDAVLVDMLQQELRTHLEATCNDRTPSQLCARYAKGHPISVGKNTDDSFLCVDAPKADPLTGLPYPNGPITFSVLGHSDLILRDRYGVPVIESHATPQWLCPKNGPLSECDPLILDSHLDKVAIAFLKNGSAVVRNLTNGNPMPIASQTYYPSTETIPSNSNLVQVSQ